MPTDKVLHFCAGALIAAALWPFGGFWALGVVIVIAIGKEVRDAQGFGTPEVADAVVTVVGGAAMYAWLHLASVSVS